MANEPNRTPTRPETPRAKERAPEWLLTVCRVCAAIYPFFLVIAVLAFILMVALIATKRTDFGWLPSANGAFGFLGGLGMLCLLIANYRRMTVACVALACGIALNYVPDGLSMLCQKVSQDAQLPLVQAVGATAHGLGTFVDLMAVVSLMGWFMLYFLTREERERGTNSGADDAPAKPAAKPSLIPKCWELSRCRPGVRKFCPNYLHKTTCWSRRGGCLCDRGIADQMISTSARGEGQEVIEMQQKANLKRGAVKAGVKPSWSEQKHVCYSCPLFTEHQDYKNRYFSWLAFPITATIIALAFNLYKSGYALATDAIHHMLSSANSPVVPTDSTMINGPFEWVVLGIIVLLLWTFIVSFMDRIFMKWKL